MVGKVMGFVIGIIFITIIYRAVKQMRKRKFDVKKGSIHFKK